MAIFIGGSKNVIDRLIIEDSSELINSSTSTSSTKSANAEPDPNAFTVYSEFKTDDEIIRALEAEMNRGTEFRMDGKYNCMVTNGIKCETGILYGVISIKPNETVVYKALINDKFIMNLQITRK